jgi:DNA-binding transcriptional MerR regulator
VWIGEVAGLAGVSAKALRDSESVGLIEQSDRMPSGYRDHSDRVLDRLRFIRAA